jgi:hypothetical protein
VPRLARLPAATGALAAVVTSSGSGWADALASSCASQLAGSCNAALSAAFGPGVVRLSYGGGGLSYANTTSQLLYQRPAVALLQRCAFSAAGGGGDAVPASASGSGANVRRSRFMNAWQSTSMTVKKAVY